MLERRVSRSASVLRKVRLRLNKVSDAVCGTSCVLHGFPIWSSVTVVTTRSTCKTARYCDTFDLTEEEEI